MEILQLTPDVSPFISLETTLQEIQWMTLQLASFTVYFHEFIERP
jgi:hypothetical protein